MKKEEIYKQVYKELKENTNEIIAAYERDEDIDDVIDTIAGNISYKLSERQDNIDHSKWHEQKALHIADVSNSLAAFMLWYKKNVPIGTQKSSEEIVSDYLSNL